MTVNVAAIPPGRSDWIAAWGIRLAVALGAAEGIAQLAAYRLDVAPGALDSTTDGGIFGVLSVAVFATAVAAAWLVAATARRRRLAVLCASLLTVVFALDLLSPAHAVAFAAPFGAAAIVTLWKLGADDPAAGRALRIGCVVLAVSFLGHALGAWIVERLGQSSDSWAYQMKVVLKHGGELAGWALVATGLVSHWRARA